VKPITPAGSESYTGIEARSLLHEEAGNRLTEKLNGQDATDPKTENSNRIQRISGQPPRPFHGETKKQEKQYNHNGHNNQEPNR
jgi:hypothetical protein